MQTLSELYSGDEGCLMDTEEGLRFQRAMRPVGNWRGLFDFADHHTWDKSSLEDKWAMIERAKSFLSCSFADLVWAWVEDCVRTNNSYRLDVIWTVIQRYAEKYQEAQVFLDTCRRLAPLQDGKLFLSCHPDELMSLLERVRAA